MEKQVNRYIKLNELAETNGIVVFGSGEDVNIPIGEIRQAFSIEPKMYNRSFKNLSITDAESIYEKCIAPLCPETVLIHIGEDDLSMFKKNSAEFDTAYRSLITYIKSQNKHCRIAVVSMKGHDDHPLISEMNKHLKHIADSERCEYIDIASRKVWNPKSTMDAASFVYSIGFVRPLKCKRPLYDLVRMLFCLEPSLTA
ncbi:MAG: hypothetical protein IJ298_06560 [Ruminococcus sp.]|nr:hypothetical protein [Ruminococcus sp.]